MYEFGVGLIIGAAQTLIGHPFDTIKILQQNNLKYSKKQLYNGVSVPLLFSGFSNSIMFGMYCQLKNKNKFSIEESAFISGAFSSIFVTPHDYLKIQFQVLKKPILRDIYKGFYITTTREALGSLIYFSCYEHGVEYFGKSSTSSFFIGGISGVLSWFLIYPIDVVKTRIMSGETNSIFCAYKFGNLWNGLAPCLHRAFLVNGVSFMLYHVLV